MRKHLASRSSTWTRYVCTPTRAFPKHQLPRALVVYSRRLWLVPYPTRPISQTMAELMRQVEISSFSGPDLDSRRDICVGESFRSAMSLDMVRLQSAPNSQLPTNIHLNTSRVCVFPDHVIADHPVVHVCRHRRLVSQGRRARGFFRILHGHNLV